MGARRARDGTVGWHLRQAGVSRREFLEFCSKLMVAAPFGLALTNVARPEDVAREVKKARRLSVVWLHFQDCTGCTESLLRTSQPDLSELIFQLISLDYHETLMAAAGADAERALRAATTGDAPFVCVAEGSIPTRDQGIYMTLAGRPALEVLHEVGGRAAAIIAIGSCASWGGIPSADPNPTGAVGVDAIITGKPIINIPGCPPNPYVLLGTVLQYARFGTLPELDDERRPRFAYDRVIHDQCPRRPHFDAGRFARQFGDEGHRQGWCLYHMGCKGPDTHAPCSVMQFNDVVNAWPIGTGAPCVGCTERTLAFRVPMFQTVPIHDATPPDFYAPVESPHGRRNLVAAGVAGVAAGWLLGAGYVASRAFKTTRGDQGVPTIPPPPGKTDGET